MDDYEKAKSLLLINTKEDELSYNINIEIDDILKKEYNAVSRVEIRKKLRSILTKYERQGWLKNFLVSTQGDYVFNIRIETKEGEVKYFVLTLKHS